VANETEICFVVLRIGELDISLSRQEAARIGLQLVKASTSDVGDWESQGTIEEIRALIKQGL